MHALLFVVGALFGGVGAAVLQPVIGHQLGTRRRRDEEREKVQRHLRRMIESELRYGREVFGALAASHQCNAYDRVPPPLRRDPLFQPERITDAALRRLVEQYDDVCTDMIVALNKGKYRGARYTDADIVAWVARFMEPEQLINVRMDELRFPLA